MYIIYIQFILNTFYYIYIYNIRKIVNYKINFPLQTKRPNVHVGKTATSVTSAVFCYLQIHLIVENFYPCSAVFYCDLIRVSNAFLICDT